MITQQEAIERIKRGLLRLPPLGINLWANEQAFPGGGKVDAVLDVTWQGHIYRFGAEYKSRSTPKEFQSALDQTSRINKATGFHPMVLMPFLNEKQLLELADRQVSGLDFSGNGVVVVPNQLFVFRSGSPNRFPASAAIQNVYRRDTSIVARSFLARPVFESVNDILRFIEARSRGTATVSLSTVSKALKGLEEDLIVSREKTTIRLLQPEKLIDKLAANFARPSMQRFLFAKSPHDTESLVHLLLENSLKQEVRLVGTGAGSAAQYAVMARENVVSVYCTDQHRLLTGIEFNEGARFHNLAVIETLDKTAYFDARTNDGFEWASPVQTYLELMAGDQRERETAGQVKEVILREAKEGLP